MTKTEQYQAAIQSLSSRSEVESFINEWQPSHEDFEGALKRLQDVYGEYHSEQKKKDIEQLMQLLKAKGIDPSELVPTKTKKSSKTSDRVDCLAVTVAGEIISVNISTVGRLGGDIAPFFEYTKGIGVTRNEISKMTREEFETRFESYINKIK